MRSIEDFDELLDIFMPWKGGVAVVLRAFFDASTRRETDTFCVAGFAFGGDRAKKAEREWRTLMGDRIGHLTDLNARQGEFSGLDKDQAGDLLKGQVRIIRKYVSFGV
ncbi:MAG TPA: hypothetical protein VEL80_03320, partial [Burkholderiales bacterium]|nr:hypothetical protein [Burkholderiales bacterium]